MKNCLQEPPSKLKTGAQCYKNKARNATYVRKSSQDGGWVDLQVDLLTLGELRVPDAIDPFA